MTAYNPSADWTLQQLREVVGDTDQYRYLIHDRDRIFANHLDASIRALGVEVVRSPIASPKANAICERLIGTIRRECLDWMIPESALHLRAILKEWIAHYNGARPHSALGPGGIFDIPHSTHRHRMPAGELVRSRAVLGGLHHEYYLANVGAAAAAIGQQSAG